MKFEAEELTQICYKICARVDEIRGPKKKKKEKNIRVYIIPHKRLQLVYRFKKSPMHQLFLRTVQCCVHCSKRISTRIV